MASSRLDSVFQQLRRVVLVQDGAGLTDEQLLELFIAEKDHAAFEALVRRYSPMVFRVCLRIIRNHHDAEDAYQATFLLLARKAASLRARDMVANWLHGVALRSALKAKTLRVKKRERERPLGLADPAALPPDPDLQSVIDLELSRLADVYRLPILLCDLEGKSIKRAAQQLGWPQGTVAGRLARGRKLLAKRSARHGLTLVGGAVALQTSASASVPPSLVALTVKAAGAIVAGKAVATGVISTNVAVLMEGALTTMFLTKIKTVAAVALLAGAITLGAGLATDGTGGAEQVMGNASEAVPGRSEGGKKPSEPKTDLDRLQGVWSVVSCEGGKSDWMMKAVFMVDGKRACWQTADRMEIDSDFKGGLYLEPTVGTQNF